MAIYNKIVVRIIDDGLIFIKQNIIKTIDPVLNQQQQQLLLLMKSRSRSLFSNMNYSNNKNKREGRRVVIENFTPTDNTNEQPSAQIQQIVKQQKAHNFILANKKNLHNFYKERLPKDNPTIFKQKPIFVSPKRIFELKKQQMTRQYNTKIILNRSFDFELSTITPSLSQNKINQIFSVNSKTKEISITPPKQIYQKAKIFKHGTSINLSSYHTPTSASIIKRSQTTNTKAYVSVFGNKEIQDKSRMLQIQCKSGFTLTNSRVNYSLKPKLQGKRPKSNLNNSKPTQQQKRKLQLLLDNLEKLAKQINPHRFDFYSDQKKLKLELQRANPEYSINQKKKTEQTQIQSWIKSVSDGYKRRNIQINYNNIRTVEDLQKIDPSYYQKMVNHKNARLQIRKKALIGINTPYLNQEFNTQKQIFQQQEQYEQKNSLDQIDKLVTITQRLDPSIQQSIDHDRRQFKIKTKRQKTVKYNNCRQKMAAFARMLIQTTNAAKLFGIQFYNIYNALLKARRPYELQGSYAFFKIIKSGNLQKVKAFIKKNLQFLYQIDHQLRSTLIYAVQNDHIQMARYLISCGINLDWQSQNGQTALICAIKKNNYQIVEDILRAGASPWSPKRFNLSSLLQYCDQRIKIAIKNAKIMHIAKSLIFNPIKRLDFWKQFCKTNIQGNLLIKIQFE